ncbi:MAG: hypothetical protein ACRDGS_08810 [Chloroflexota bacterium]
MYRSRLEYRALLAMLVVILPLVLGEWAPSLHAAPATNVRGLFPPASVYPKGTHLLPLYISTRVSDVADPAVAVQVDRFRFLVGGVQDANLPTQAVTSVTVLAFADARVANAFLHAYHPSELQNPAAPGTPISRFGVGARYIVGGCANCGPTAPRLGVLLLRREASTVEIVSQPPNHALVMRLANAINHPGTRTP